MPDPARKSLTILNDAFNKIKSRYDIENTDKSFVKWVSEYLLMNLERDDFLAKYAPFLHTIGIQDNSLYLKDSKTDKVIEINYKDGKLQCSEDNPIYLQYAMAMPELARLKS